jgi:hypothetical protein
MVIVYNPLLGLVDHLYKHYPSLASRARPGDTGEGRCVVTVDGHLFDPDVFLRLMDPCRPDATLLIDEITERFRQQLVLDALAVAAEDESDIVTAQTVRRADARRRELERPETIWSHVLLGIGTLFAGGGLSGVATILSGATSAWLIVASFVLCVVGFGCTGFGTAIFVRRAYERRTRRASRDSSARSPC